MPTSPCEWIRTFVRTVAWLALAGCAITFVALSAPYLLSEPLPRTNDSEEAQVRFMRRVLAGTEACGMTFFVRQADAMKSQHWCYSRRSHDRPAPCASCHGTLLLPGRSENLPGSELLRGA